jgi:hypothetical protein
MESRMEKKEFTEELAEADNRVISAGENLWRY